MYAFRKDEPVYDILGAPGWLGRVGPQRTRKLGLPNLSPAEWESAERQRECNYAVTNNGFVRLLARDLLVGPLPDG